MSERYEPALSAAEWKEWLSTGSIDRQTDDAALASFLAGRTGDFVVSCPEGEVIIDATERDAVAALLLFGVGADGTPLFTWEDVEWLRSVAADREAEAEREGIASGAYEVVTWANSLAARLSALLPPR